VYRRKFLKEYSGHTSISLIGIFLVMARRKHEESMRKGWK
jgi:hypothetical protein